MYKAHLWLKATWLFLPSRQVSAQVRCAWAQVRCQPYQGSVPLLSSHCGLAVITTLQHSWDFGAQLLSGGGTGATNPFHRLLPAHPAWCRTKRENKAQASRWQMTWRGYWHGWSNIPAKSQLQLCHRLCHAGRTWHRSETLWSLSLVFLEWYQHKAAATRWWFRPSMNGRAWLVTLLHAKRGCARKFTASSILALRSALQTPFQNKYIC